MALDRTTGSRLPPKKKKTLPKPKPKPRTLPRPKPRIPVGTNAARPPVHGDFQDRARTTGGGSLVLDQPKRKPNLLKGRGTTARAVPEQLDRIAERTTTALRPHDARAVERYVLNPQSFREGIERAPDRAKAPGVKHTRAEFTLRRLREVESRGIPLTPKLARAAEVLQGRPALGGGTDRLDVLREQGAAEGRALYQAEQAALDSGRVRSTATSPDSPTPWVSANKPRSVPVLPQRQLASLQRTAAQGRITPKTFEQASEKPLRELIGMSGTTQREQYAQLGRGTVGEGEHPYYPTLDAGQWRRADARAREVGLPPPQNYLQARFALHAEDPSWLDLSKTLPISAAKLLAQAPAGVVGLAHDVVGPAVLRHDLRPAWEEAKRTYRDVKDLPSRNEFIQNPALAIATYGLAPFGGAGAVGKAAAAGRLGKVGKRAAGELGEARTLNVQLGDESRDVVLGRYSTNPITYGAQRVGDFVAEGTANARPGLVGRADRKLGTWKGDRLEKRAVSRETHAQVLTGAAGTQDAASRYGKVRGVDPDSPLGGGTGRHRAGLVLYTRGKGITDPRQMVEQAQNRSAKLRKRLDEANDLIENVEGLKVDIRTRESAHVDRIAELKREREKLTKGHKGEATKKINAEQRKLDQISVELEELASRVQKAQNEHPALTDRLRNAENNLKRWQEEYGPALGEITESDVKFARGAAGISRQMEDLRLGGTRTDHRGRTIPLARGEDHVRGAYQDLAAFLEDVPSDPRHKVAIDYLEADRKLTEVRKELEDFDSEARERGLTDQGRSDRKHLAENVGSATTNQRRALLELREAHRDHVGAEPGPRARVGEGEHATDVLTMPERLDVDDPAYVPSAHTPDELLDRFGAPTNKLSGGREKMKTGERFTEGEYNPDERNFAAAAMDTPDKVARAGATQRFLDRHGVQLDPNREGDIALPEGVKIVAANRKTIWDGPEERHYYEPDEEQVASGGDAVEVLNTPQGRVARFRHREEGYTQGEAPSKLYYLVREDAWNELRRHVVEQQQEGLSKTERFNAAWRRGALLYRPAWSLTNAVSQGLQSGVVGAGATDYWNTLGTRNQRFIPPPARSGRSFAAHELSTAIDPREGRVGVATGGDLSHGYIRGVLNTQAPVVRLGDDGILRAEDLGAHERLANVAHLLPRTVAQMNRTFENWSQRAAGYSQVKKAAKEMLRNAEDVSETLEEVMARVARGIGEGDPLLVHLDEAVQRVLGDFSKPDWAKNKVIDGALGIAVPFHRWLRFSLELMFYQMPLHHPLTTTALYGLGQIGEEYNDAWSSRYPSFFQGGVRLPNGQVISTQPANPGSTLYGLLGLDPNRVNPMNLGVGMGRALGPVPRFIAGVGGRSNLLGGVDLKDEYGAKLNPFEPRNILANLWRSAAPNQAILTPFDENRPGNWLPFFGPDPRDPNAAEEATSMRPGDRGEALWGAGLPFVPRTVLDSNQARKYDQMATEDWNARLHQRATRKRLRSGD